MLLCGSYQRRPPVDSWGLLDHRSLLVSCGPQGPMSSLPGGIFSAGVLEGSIEFAVGHLGLDRDTRPARKHV